MKNWVIITLSVIIVLLGGAICGVLVLTKPSASQKQRSILLPVVDVITVSSADYTVKIDSQGEVLPSRRTSLAAEVAGRVVRVSPKLEVGERFAADEILLEIDRADYESAEVLAASELAVAELALEQEQARSEQAKRDWDALGGGRKASDLVLRKPQLKSALRRVDAAQSGLEKALRDLSRTRVRAPYACQVKATFAEQGSSVAAGGLVADVFSREFELRLPVSLEDYGFIDPEAKVAVSYHAKFGGEEVEWEGKLIRTEGRVDRGSQSVFLVTSILPGETGTPAAKFLAPGLFLKAELTGKTLGGVYRLPRKAFYGKDRILVVSPGNTVALRTVKVVRTEHDEVVIGDGLEEGERVAVSPVPNVIDGMSIKVNNQESPATLHPEEVGSGD